MATKQIKEYDPKSSTVSTDQILIQQSNGIYAKTTLGDIHKMKVGFFDYNDNATASAPIIITGGGGFIDLTNDELGSFTNKSFPPTDVSDVWDPALNVFDWSELALGDMVDIRVDVIVTTVSPNTEINVALELGIGGGLYSIPFVHHHNIKAAGTNGVVAYSGLYMGDSNTLANGGKFKFMADKDCSVVVNGWYCRIIRR